MTWLTEERLNEIFNRNSPFLFQAGGERVMTTNAIRGIRRKKSSLSEVKLAVIGAPSVGKSGKHLLPF